MADLLAFEFLDPADVLEKKRIAEKKQKFIKQFEQDKRRANRARKRSRRRARGEYDY